MNSRLGNINGLSWEKGRQRLDNDRENTFSEKVGLKSANDEFSRRGKSSNNPSFKGISAKNGLSNFVKFVDNGGYLVEFCILDMFSMILPRTFLAFRRNHEQLGHPNYKAGTEEAIREFLTGPSMFLIPLTFITLAGKMAGNSAWLEVEPLKVFNNKLMDVAHKNNSDNGFKDHKTLRSEFLDEVMDDSFQEFKKTKDSKFIAHEYVSEADENKHISLKDFNDHNNRVDEIKGKIKDLIIKIDDTEKPSASTRFKEKMHSAQQFVERHINKMPKPSTEPTSLDKIGMYVEELHKISNVGLNTPETIKLASDAKSVSYGDYVDHICKYSQDVLKKLSEKTKSKNIEDAAKQITKIKWNVRIATVAIAIVATGSFLYCIPKLYQRNKNYPGTDGLRDNSNQDSLKAKEISDKKEKDPTSKKAEGGQQ